MIWLYIVLGVAAFILLFYLIGGFIAFRLVLYNSQKSKDSQTDIPSDETFRKSIESIVPYIQDLIDEPCEDVYIKSFDKTKLRGRIYYYKKDAPFVIACHGYRGAALRDFCGGFRIDKKNNFNILLIDERAHKKSGGHVITMGIKERKDLLCWIDYIVNRYGDETKIILQGISMGASTVLMCASQLNIPSNVIAVTADCPYSSIKKEFQYNIKHSKGPSKLGYSLIWFGAFLYGHINLSSCDLNKSIMNIKVPTLIVHGDGDTMVPSYFSEELKRKSPYIERFTFPYAEHGMSFVSNEKRYEDIMTSFFNKVLEKNSD